MSYMIAAKLLLLAALASPFVATDCGADDDRAKPSGCPPAVMWLQPDYGTVTKTRNCPGMFGSGTVRYAYVKGDVASGWVTDYQGLCSRGDSWVGGSGCE